MFIIIYGRALFGVEITTITVEVNKGIGYYIVVNLRGLRSY